MGIMKPALEEPRPWADDERLQDPFQLGAMNLVMKLVQEFATLAEKLPEGRMLKTQSIPAAWECEHTCSFTLAALQKCCKCAALWQIHSTHTTIPSCSAVYTCSLPCCNSNGLLPCTIATNIGYEREKGIAHYTLYRMRKAECNARCTLYYRMCTRECNT